MRDVPTPVREMTGRKRAEEPTLEALPSHIAVLDEAGSILGVNGAGCRFADPDQRDLPDYAVGANYLEICDRAWGEGTELARATATAIRQVIAGQRDEYHLADPLRGPRGKRWFTVRVARFRLAGAERLLVTHEDVTGPKRTAEEALRRGGEAEAFAALARNLAASLELDDILARLVGEARWLSQSDMAFLAMADGDGQTLSVRAQTGAVSSALQGLTVERGKGMAGIVLETGEPLVTADYPQDPRFSHEHDIAVRADGVVVQAGIPVLHERSPLGVLMVGRRTPRAFTPAEVETLIHLAEAASMACHHALLYDRASRRAAALARLWQLGQALSRSLALPETLPRIVETARELLRSDHALLTLWNETAQTLTEAARTGGEDPRLVRTFQLGHGAHGTAAESRRPLIANNYQTFPNRIPELTDTIRATAVIPLLIEERLLGTLGVYATVPGRTFTTEDLQLLELLGQKAGIALENARLFEQVHAGREQVRAVSRRLVEVQESKGRELARELHDEIGQLLTGLKLSLEMSRRVPADKRKARLREADGLVDDLLARVRELSLDLRPTMLDDLGLLPALLWHTERYTAQTRVRVTLRHAGVEGRRFPLELETAIYRIVQEALTNVARHAGVREVTVKLWADQDTLGMQVEDQGKGFEPEAAMAAYASTGLTGMRERATLLGGQLTVESAPGTGTRVTAELPLGERTERRAQERGA